MSARTLFIIGVILIFFAAIIATEETPSDTQPLITKVPPRGTPP